MSGFLYYIPGIESKPDREQITHHGIAHAFSQGESIQFRRARTGPAGLPGVVFQPGQNAAGVGYKPSEQTWQKVPGSQAWIGYAKDSLPTEQSLRRAVQLSGHEVELGDKAKWLVPLARGAQDVGGDLVYFAAIERTMQLNDEGQWAEGEVLPEYQLLWQLGERVWDTLISGVTDDGKTNVEMAVDEVLDGAVAALSHNYRVGRVEASILGLLTENKAVDVLRAVIDWPTISAWLQKKSQPSQTPDGSSISDGPADDTLTTDQPLQTSGPLPKGSDAHGV